MATLIAAQDAATAAPAVRRRPRVRWSVGRVVGWAVMALMMFATLFPFYWMLRTAFSNTRALSSHYASLAPAEFTWGAFQRVFGMQSTAQAIAEGGSGASLNFWLFLRNSFVVATTTTVCQVLFCALAAYAFARLRWPGRNQLFFVFLTAMMIPGVFTTLPNFVLIRDLGLLNTLLGIVLPALFMAPFSVFFLRQFFLSIPTEVEEAAKIDGASHLRIFFRVIVPMSSAPITTLALLTYITSWNDYLWPLLVGKDDSSKVLTVALGVFRQQTPSGAPDWAGLMAATFVSAIPVLILYAIVGKRIVSSIGFTGIK
ncbi:carbohydrate ABC transporter permease [Xylanimonas sp. McL0601]|uniref:carbohydrate ABC transporter permease n=1 Tax=Xylanimonas sp. McL0601 TaxID=3414739 RepID=UPI003CEB1F6B